MKLRSRTYFGYALLVILVVVVGAVTKLYLASVPVAIVKGNSMYPLLREGDIVFIARVNPRDVFVGDVIVFSTPGGRLVVHRVVEVVEFNGRRYFVTQGDNNPIKDFYYPIGVPDDRLIGRLATVGDAIIKIPYVGSVALFFRK